MATSSARDSISVPSPKHTARTGPRASHAVDVAREHHLGTEPPGLRHGAMGEVGAGEALREPEVVLDRRTLARLTARGLTLDHHGLQSLRRAVDRGGEPGRAGADDAQVVEGLLGAGAQAERGGEVEGGGRTQGLVPGGQHER